MGTPFFPDIFVGASVERVGLMTWWPKFETRLRRICASPLLKHVRKEVGGFEKDSCVSNGVRKPGNTCVTDGHMTLAVRGVEPQYNQPHICGPVNIQPQPSKRIAQ